MPEELGDKTKEILVITSETDTRSFGVKKINVEDLSIQVNLFLEQMNSVLDKSPEKVGSFYFDSFEISAEITAKGSIALLGTGGEVGTKGGLKFIFKRDKSS